MDARRFGYSVGRFFKKIDRTLSFLPEKPRKAVVMATAFAVTPVLVGVIISKAKPSQHVDDIKNEKAESVIDTSLLKDINITPDLVSPFDDEYDGYRYGPEGFGYYMFGKKVS